MKKFTLIAGMALVGLAATAQDFNVENGNMDAFAAKYGKGTYYSLLMSENTAEKLKAGGSTIVEFGDNSSTRHLYVWDGTFVGGNSSLPAPGWDDENMDFEYLSLDVTNVGWSGAGFTFDEPGESVAFNENTIFHASYATNSTAPASAAFILCDGSEAGASPAKIAVGADFNDNGKVYPSVGSAITDDWKTVEIKFSDIKKLCPSFTYFSGSFYGNIMSFLAGGVSGTNISLNNVFFFNASDAAINDVEADINAPVKYFNLQGVEVANPTEGLFIKVQGNKAQKVVL